MAAAPKDDDVEIAVVVVVEERTAGADHTIDYKSENVGERVAAMLDGVAFRHGFTYNGHATGCAVALENLAIYGVLYIGIASILGLTLNAAFNMLRAYLLRGFPEER